MALIMVINLVAVRFLRSHSGLGVEGYGVYNAVNGVVSLFACLNSVLAAASQRFFSVKMGERDEAGLRNIFQISAHISWLMASVAFLLFETVGLWFVINKMNYPVEWFAEVMVVYQAAIVAFIALLIQVPYLAAVMAHEKMNVFAVVTLLGAILNFILAFALRYIPSHHLMTYGLGWAGTAILSTVLFILYAKRHFLETQRAPITDKSEYKSLLSFTGWTMFGSLAGAAMIQGNTLLINTYVGPIANAAFAVAVQIYYSVSQLGNNVFVAVRPQMIQTYAQVNYGETKRLFWLSTIVVLGWMLLVAVILILSVPITTVMEASGKVREYHLPVELSILLSVPISWMLLANGAPVIYVAYALIGGVVVAHIVRLIVMKKYAYK